MTTAPAMVVTGGRFVGQRTSHWMSAGETAKELLEEGAYSVNSRNELAWTTEPAPGETCEPGYEYSVLVDI
jgi:hypothetical protein